MNNDFAPGGAPRKQITLAQPGRETRAETTRRERRFRADSVEAQGFRLAVPPEHRKDGYEYRWVNDKANGRVEAFTGRDWDVVKNAAIDGTGEGTPVSRVVGTTESGQPLRAYLMEKPTDWHQEDQARKNAPRVEIEETMKRGPLPQPGAEPGTAYVPQGHRNTIGQS